MKIRNPWVKNCEMMIANPWAKKNEMNISNPVLKFEILISKPEVEIWNLNLKSLSWKLGDANIKSLIERHEMKNLHHLVMKICDVNLKPLKEQSWMSQSFFYWKSFFFHGKFWDHSVFNTIFLCWGLHFNIPHSRFWPFLQRYSLANVRRTFLAQEQISNNQIWSTCISSSGLIKFN